MHNILQEHLVSIWRNLQTSNFQTRFSVVMHIDEKKESKSIAILVFLLNISNGSNVFWISPAVFSESFYGSTNDFVEGFFRFLKPLDRHTFAVRCMLVSLSYHTL